MTILALLEKLSLFVRLHLFGYTATSVLVGVGLTETSISNQRLIGWVFVAIFYHIFAYVSNDLMDLEIDRTAAARQHSLLVSGEVSTFKGWLLVFFVLGGTFVFVWWLQHHLFAMCMLALGLAAIWLYNWKSKRSSFPPLFDGLQGIAFGALLLLGFSPDAADNFSLLFWLFLYQIAFIMLVNGFHSSLRDIKNDRQHHACTSAILLGATLDEHDRLVISQRLKNYVIALNVILLGLLIGTLMTVVKLYPDIQRSWYGFMTGGLVLVCWLLAQQGWKMLNRRPNVVSTDFYKLLLIGSSHMIVLLLIPFVLVFSLLPAVIRVTIVWLFAGSLILGTAALTGFQLQTLKS